VVGGAAVGFGAGVVDLRNIVGAGVVADGGA
jgi:hypothetical protein